MLTDVVGCGCAGAKQEFEPAAALALRVDFAATNEIALRDDADQPASGVDHRKPADMMLQHGVRSFEDGGVGRNRDDGPGHDLVGAHGDLLFYVLMERRSAAVAELRLF